MTFFFLMAEWAPELLPAAVSTLRLMTWSFVVAMVVGLCLALARLSGTRWLQAATACYIEAVRGMPALTLLLLIYFGLPSAGIVLNAFVAAVVGLGLHGAAYTCEIFRAGIQAIPPDQREAAQMIGMRRTQAMRFIILPQAFSIVLPAIGNFSISLLKETSVASLISAPELMLAARDISSEYFQPLQVYISIGIIYLAMALPLSGLTHFLESRRKHVIQ